MSNKIYAVKAGRETGLFHSWDEAQKHVSGYPGAKFKAFHSIADANAYLGIDHFPSTKEIFDAVAATMKPTPSMTAVVSVDGSYNQQTGIYGYGYTIEYDGQTIEGFGGENVPELASMRQIAGEIIGAEIGLMRAIELGADRIELHYDYKGIELWVTNEWQANKTYTQRYRNTMQEMIENYKGTVVFVKDAAHTGIAGNERADVLAKKGAGIH